MKSRLLVLSLALVLLNTACKKNESPVTNPTQGRITGSVHLYNEGTLPLDNSGMTISVEGSNPLIKTTTSSTGSFTLDNVPYGIRTLIYEKEGFGTFRKPNINHVYNNGLNTTLDTISSLGQKSGTSVIAATCQPDGNDLIVEITTQPPANNSNRKYIRLFLDSKSGVSSSSYAAYTENYVVGINPAEIRITAASLTKMGFNTGEQIYIRAYGDSFWSNDYIDISTGKRVFPNLNPATAAEVQITIL